MDSCAPGPEAPPSGCSLPRVLIGATHSGAGKTSFTLGLLAALKNRGVKVQAFKAGPDYIDPALHSVLTPRPSRNLDTRLLTPQCVRALFQRHAAGTDIALIEGVMGYYDGSGPAGRSGSTAEVARILHVPAVLIIDARGAGESAAATAQGFVRYRNPSGIAGFLLNRIGSTRHFAETSAAITNATGLPVFGYLPRDDGLCLPERHLGLVGPSGGDAFWTAVDRIQRAIEAHVDVDGILALARSAPGTRAAPLWLPLADREHGCGRRKPVRVGVARDEAFGFYYEDNLDILRGLGAEIVFFSPLRDRDLPPAIAGLYFGGGYPELYVAEIAANEGMRRAVRTAAADGLPIFAECGGFMYLLEEIEDASGTRYPAAGVFDGRAVMNRRNAALGYFDAEVVTDCLVGAKGTRLLGHAFHWSTAEGRDPRLPPALILRRPGSPAMADGMSRGNVFASYLHLHFAGHPEVARRIIAHCRSYTRARGLVRA